MQLIAFKFIICNQALFSKEAKAPKKARTLHSSKKPMPGIGASDNHEILNKELHQGKVSSQFFILFLFNGHPLIPVLKVLIH